MKKVSKQSAKFLSFNNTNIYFVDVNGVNWIAIKPICDALNIDHSAQYKKIKKDDILLSEYANLPIQVQDDQLRDYMCLPEKFIYGWIFSIQSNSEELKKYKKECYEILYNHFHGTITKRKEYLEEKAIALAEKNMKFDKLKELPEYKEFVEAKNKVAYLSTTLSKQDTVIIETKLKSLFEQDFVKN